MDRAKCESCDADIFWAVTVNGRRIPLNPPELRCVPVTPGASIVKVTDTHAPHFATCPHASQHRRKKP